MSWLALLFALLLRAAPDELPRFVDGDLAKLRCDVAERAEAGPWSTRLAVDVKNSGKSAAEPLRFRVRVVPKGKGATPVETVVARAAFPLAQRCGRPALPGGKTRYWLMVARIDECAKVEVTVEEASFFEGAAPAKPALRVAALDAAEQQDALGAPVSVMKATVENPLPHTVDALFLATFTAPKDAKALVGLRLAPGTSETLITQLSGLLTFTTGAPNVAVRITKLELLDWCLWVGDAPERAAELFRPAYAKWVRWEEPGPALAGRFRWSLDRPKLTTLPDERDIALRASGRFELGSDGAVLVALDPECAADPQLAPTLLKDAQKSVEAAFGDLRRRAVDAIDPAQLVRVGSEAVAVRGPGFWLAGENGWRLTGAGDRSFDAPNFTVRDGAIVGSGLGEELQQELWTTQPLGDGYVVTARQNATGQWSRQWSYGLVGALPVPRRYREYFGMGDGRVMSESIVELQEVALQPGTSQLAPAAPAGEGAAALQAAWENGYRYPATRRRLRGRFVVEQPATDLLWRGQPKVAGSFRLDEFCGFLNDSSGWREATIELDGDRTPELEQALVFAFSDRLLMWAQPDWNGRRDFAAEFAGATIAPPDAEGRLALIGHPLAAVHVRDGRVVALEQRGGSLRKLTWSKVADQQLVTRIERGDERLEARFTKVGDRLLPERLDFVAVFGKEWGPERIELKELRLE